MNNELQFVCVDNNGYIIGLRSVSGGYYPYEAGKYGLAGVYFWNSRKEAQKYADTYPGLIVKQFNFTLTD